MLVTGEDKILDSKDVAKLLGCCVPTARHIMHQKGFPLIKVGTALKVHSVAFENWCLNQRNR